MADQGQRLVVTGASGFVGQHLVAAALAAGEEVLAVVRKPFFAERPGLREASADIAAGAGYLRDELRAGDRVIHLACLPTNPSDADPRLSFETNAAGTFHLLESCRAAGVQRLVFASSSAVYGAAAEGPVAESDLPEPTTIYGAAKLAAEALTAVYSPSFLRGALTLRLFNIFGPQANGSPRATVDEIFAQAARDGRPVRINGHRDAGKDFVFVADVVQALLAAAASSVTGVINVGSGEATSLWQIAIAAGVPPEDIQLDQAAPAAPSFWAATRKARDLLAFRCSLKILDYVASIGADPARRR